MVTEEPIIHCNVHGTSRRLFVFYFMTWDIIILSIITYKKTNILAIMECTWLATILRYTMSFRWCLIVLKSPVCTKKMFPTWLYHHQLLTRGSKRLCCVSFICMLQQRLRFNRLSDIFCAEFAEHVLNVTTNSCSWHSTCYASKTFFCSQKL